MRFANSSAPARRENANNNIVKLMTRMAGIVFLMSRLADTMLVTAKSFELFLRRARAQGKSAE
jgi:hypothetical protein